MRSPSGKAYYVYGSVIYAIYIKYQNNIYLYGQIIGFTVMDKQLLLTEMRLTRCRFKPCIENMVLCWQHFSRLTLLSLMAGLDVGKHILTYIGFSASKWPETFSNDWRHIINTCHWKSEFLWLPSDFIRLINCINVPDVLNVPTAVHVLIVVQLRFHSVFMWYPVTILHVRVNFYSKTWWCLWTTLHGMLWSCATQPSLAVPLFPEKLDKYYQI